MRNASKTRKVAVSHKEELADTTESLSSSSVQQIVKMTIDELHRPKYEANQCMTIKPPTFEVEMTSYNSQPEADVDPESADKEVSICSYVGLETHAAYTVVGSALEFFQNSDTERFVIEIVRRK